MTAKVKRKTAKRNPALVTFGNPPRTNAVKSRRVVAQLSRRVCHVEYQHVDSPGRPYRHVFKPGVCCELLTDGSIRIYSSSGKPLFKWFD